MKNVYDDPAYAGVVKELKAELRRPRRQYKDDDRVVGGKRQPKRKQPPKAL